MLSNFLFNRKGKKSRSPKEYPTIVIGAGLGGLCCAANLARAKVPVTVIEQHSVAGGYATSFTRTEGKYLFEVSLHGVSINNNATESILCNAGVLDRIERVPLKETYRLITPSYDLTVPQKDPLSYIRLLTKHFPAEAANIARFVKFITGLSEEVDRLHHQKGRIFKPAFPFQYRRMWAVRNKTLGELMDQFTKNRHLKQILSALWFYYGLPPSRLSGFYYGFATGDYLKNGSYYIKNRSQDLSNAFVKVIEENGGKIIYRSRIEKISISRNKVVGVITNKGETIKARAVVSNASAPATLQDMLPENTLPQKYLNRLQSLRPSMGSFIVWLGLKDTLQDKISGSGIYVYTAKGPEAEYQASVNGDIEHTAFSVSVYDNIFAGYSQPGVSTLMIGALSGYAPWKPFEQDYFKGEKKAYREQKDKWAQVLLKRTEETVLPNIREKIEVCVTASPLTNLRYTGNPGGAIYGFEQSMDNQFMSRFDNRTPVKGLYLTGAWTFPGGGYTAVLWSGEKVFRELMRQWKLKK